MKKRLSTQTKMRLVQSCVGELCVIRWCRTYERDENGEDSIVGLYGHRTTFRQIQGELSANHIKDQSEREFEAPFFRFLLLIRLFSFKF